ncbi:hypothetical protein H8B06_05960 [Sphingobacterium sp. DN00404]|uniref:SIR2-like domain-containing protein n=1 Tax=Sphingobacterium micropteri TaxID=2763501 RepID=A0ABR7YM25_9SPHI|nr:hypothetical protein [Sphingobacterium micropteri]MBD1432362.1 hypothetical protein [Sphingobacterium micropteri]
MKQTLLFGNGINYLSENFISWKELLEIIKGENLFENGKLPNTMIYERGIIGNPVSFDTLSKKEGFIKEQIAKRLSTHPTNKYYFDFFRLGFQNYLTTNYDYTFINSLKEEISFEITEKSTEGVYSVRRKKTIVTENKEFDIWHIHGEINTIPSIMLGLDHYCGSIGKIDSYVKGNYTYQLNNQKVGTKSISDKLKSGEFDGISWIELFFNSDIHIVGFGFDYSEIDLWWILNKRARMMLSNNSEKQIKNTIYYYTTEEDKDQTELLKSLNVKLVYIKKDSTKNPYPQAYKKIISSIRKNIA